MKKTIFHCLFEQSGTFRDVFRSHGHEAYCYDIQNEYDKTDFQIDLFKQIEKEYDNLTIFANDPRPSKTIFSTMNPETDFIMAFFPCTYFSGIQQLNFRLMNKGLLSSTKKSFSKEIMTKLLEKVKNRTYYFELWIKFCFICAELGIRTIIENPASYPSYVDLFSFIPVAYKEKNRSLFGDKFIKPTLYFAINFKMKEKIMMFDLEPRTKRIMDTGNRAGHKTKHKACAKSGSKERSEITPRYAENFYKRFIEHTLTSEQIIPMQPKAEELNLFNYK